MTEEHRATGRAPVLVWLLVAAGLVQVVLWGVTNATRLFGPFLILRVEDFATIVTGVAPFLVAAGILLAAGRWPAGRRWLDMGAALFAITGGVALATNAWWAWWMMDPRVPEGLVQPAMVAATAVALLAASLAPLCVAFGIARARPALPARSGVRPVVLVLGAVALVGGLALLVRELSLSSNVADDGVLVIGAATVYRVLVTLGGLSLVALALAALRAMPSNRPQPEGLIAAGASTAVVGLTASWIGQALLSFEEQAEQVTAVFTIPGIVTAIGWVLLIAGFGAAALLVGAAEPPMTTDGSRRAEPARG